MSADSDRELSRLYRAGAPEEPPAWLDKAVLAASRARAHGDSAAEQRGPARWQVPLALAAVLTLATSLTLLIDEALETAPVPDEAPTRLAPAPRAAPDSREDDAARRSVPEAMHRSAGKEPVPSSTGPAPARQPLSMQAQPAQRSDMAAGRAAREEIEAESRQRALRRDFDATKPAERKASAAARMGESWSHDERARMAAELPSQRSAEQRVPVLEPHAKHERLPADAPASVAATGAPPAGIEPPSAPAPATTASQKANTEATDDALAPEQWLREIEQLRRAGRAEEARVRLDAFRKRFPDYPLPQSLR